jgi:hypothetical protein
MTLESLLAGARALGYHAARFGAMGVDKQMANRVDV